MTQHKHQTAPTQFVEAKGIRFAYRRFGKAGGVPLVRRLVLVGTGPRGGQNMATLTPEAQQVFCATYNHPAIDAGHQWRQ